VPSDTGGRLEIREEPVGATRRPEGRLVDVVGLFAGIGGLELGFSRAGHTPVLLCELDPAAQAVLGRRFDAQLHSDIRRLRALPPCDVVTAGFPCQDLSQAGRLAGIGGKHSALVNEVFRLARRQRGGPEWIVLENVPFMLQLDRGRAMKYITTRLSELGFRWAYRFVDTRAFGRPQRRRRVIVLASRKHDPGSVLFDGSHPEPDFSVLKDVACGFYWTEGNTGLGWAQNAVPTLKGGSSLAIPSPPAIWTRTGAIGIPDIRDAERLQGFPVNWTKPAETVDARGGRVRWRLVGNAVSVPVAKWIGARLMSGREAQYDGRVLRGSFRWPTAAWGSPNGDVFGCDLSTWPVAWKYKELEAFLRFGLTPLSARATSGFLTRITASSLRYPEEFSADLRQHCEALRAA
jgi:DNA (cytosine-5)-methyltransferase 1